MQRRIVRVMKKEKWASFCRLNIEEKSGVMKRFYPKTRRKGGLNERGNDEYRL
jgi:hypothetical protein